MKCRKKLIVSGLIGLTVLTSSCSKKSEPVQLLRSKVLDYPSASAIEYYGGRLYVFGDDATHLLVLSPEHQILDSVHFWPTSEKRIDKKSKHDIESSMILVKNGEPVLYGIGSMSDTNRKKVFKYFFQAGSVVTDTLPATLFAGVPSINIEGSCIVNKTIFFANRANLAQPDNHLIAWKDNGSTGLLKLVLPVTPGKVPGLSGIYYLKEKDLLLFTASEEQTKSTTADGMIGESHLGWIENFSSKMNRTELQPDRLINLAHTGPAFMEQKIESVCVEKISNDKITLHAVADNDNGKSTVFTLLLQL